MRTNALDYNHCRGKLVCHYVPSTKNSAYRRYLEFFLMNGQISLIRPIFLSWWLISKEFACNAGDLGLIPGSGRSFGEGNGNPLQYSCLENPIDRGFWWPWGHKESDTTMQLNSNRRPIFTFQPLFHPRAISILGKGPPEKEISHKFFFQ